MFQQNYYTGWMLLWLKKIPYLQINRHQNQITSSKNIDKQYGSNNACNLRKKHDQSCKSWTDPAS